MIQLIAEAYAGPGDEVLFHQYGYQGFHKAARMTGATPVVAAERDLSVDVEALAIWRESGRRSSSSPTRTIRPVPMCRPSRSSG